MAGKRGTCALRPGLLVVAAAHVPVSEGVQPGLRQSSVWLVGWQEAPSPPSQASALLGRYLACLPLQQMFDSPCKVDHSKAKEIGNRAHSSFPHITAC